MLRIAAGADPKRVATGAGYSSVVTVLNRYGAATASSHDQDPHKAAESRVFKGFRRGRWRTRTADLCRVNETDAEIDRTSANDDGPETQ